MRPLLALVVFAFVGTLSPGPNNTLLWASGMRYGFRRSLPHVLGTALGIGALALGVAAGIGALLDAVPAAGIALKVVGSAYLLYVAYLVLAGGVLEGTEISHPLNLRQGFVFQCVNPKAWIFTVAAVGTFLSRTLSRPAAAALLAAVLMLVVVASSSIWAAAGAGIGGVVADGRTLHAINVTLAALLVASVALIWI